ncbi:protein-L-isoaspartate(D-aspartate) O-methyltransferase [Reichenbachiella sp. MALMAid0571]|uniref:protein-L-isoaspartate(D-aspartate) O-methyltransferase n=1 Tax=Reichenbachiella sp. MALMAid0571 TaxID=3143939 RepID=UPI0032DFAA57
MTDSYKHKGMRRSLVRILKEKGITDDAVLNAIGRIPRHYFFDQVFEGHAYQDKAFPIGEGQTISQPYTVAFQTSLLEVKPKAKILEIGTGSGYQACVLQELGVNLFTIEYNKVLYARTKAFLPKMGYNPRFFVGDGSKGLRAHAPYDGIIVTAGAPTVPDALVKQLKIGGKLVIPVGDKSTQKMLRITKIAEDQVEQEEFDNFSFVPLLGDKGWN